MAAVQVGFEPLEEADQVVLVQVPLVEAGLAEGLGAADWVVLVLGASGLVVPDPGASDRVVLVQAEAQVASDLVAFE